MRRISVIVFSLWAIPAFAQQVTPEINLRYQLGQALTAQAVAEARNLQDADAMKKAYGERDWWIACDTACRDWALGGKK